jgi:hypothetical protein
MALNIFAAPALCSFAEVGEVFDLLGRQFVNLYAHRFEFQRADGVFDFDGDVINRSGQGIGVFNDVFGLERLRGERHIHNAGGVTFCGGEIN